MKSKKEVKHFQEFLLNSWPAKHYFFLNGWICRFTDGITSRANSVFPLRYTGTHETLDYDIDIVEQAYKAHNLPPVFTMHEFHEPKELKKKLLKRGYLPYDFTNVLFANVNNIKRNSINREFEYELHFIRPKEISEFLALYSNRNRDQQKVINEITERIIVPKKCFLIARSQNEVIGTLMGVLIPQGYLYIADVLVDPKFRRRQVATSMMDEIINEWALQSGAKIIWLQVENDNHVALNLYNKLGMKKLYSYYYMTIF